MSLLQLLTTGKALEGAHNSPHRYRLTNHRLLPKFGSKQNPFAAKESSVSAPQSGDAKPSTASAETKPSSPKGGSSRRNYKSALEKLLPWLKSLRLPRFHLRGKRNPTAAQPSVAMPASVATQGELRLEGIRVVRNDLSETDLEIVTGSGDKAKTEGNEAHPETVEPGARETGDGSTKLQVGPPLRVRKEAQLGTWEKVRSRLVGAGKD